MANSERVSKQVTIAHVLDILETRKKDGELGYEQQLSYDYAKKFAKLEPKVGAKLVQELESLGISQKGAISIVDTMPAEMIQLKQILANEKKTVEQEVADKAMAIVEKHRGK